MRDGMLDAGAFLFRTHIASILRIIRSPILHWTRFICINEWLTLDSPRKLDSNRYDSEAARGFFRTGYKQFSRGPKAWRAHTRRARAFNPIRSRDWRNRSRNRPIF